MDDDESQRDKKANDNDLHTFFSFSFLTRDSMALFAKLSDSPPCLWQIKLCTMLKQASLLLGVGIAIII